jgi:hypothetical protein
MYIYIIYAYIYVKLKFDLILSKIIFEHLIIIYTLNNQLVIEAH